MAAAAAGVGVGAVLAALRHEIRLAATRIRHEIRIELEQGLVLWLARLLLPPAPCEERPLRPQQSRAQHRS